MIPLKQVFRDGTPAAASDRQDRRLAKLYGSTFGRLLLRPLTARWVSKLVGKFLSTGMSKCLISSFVKKNGIDMAQYLPVEYKSYNEFFCRQIRPELRPIDADPRHLISPCDSKLTVLPITPELHFTLKQTEYTVSSLLKNGELAQRYAGGYALIFRLTVDDYHRYCYVADGEKSEDVRIQGVLHTVNPIANDYFPIYKENTRHYSFLGTRYFGRVLMMEVGALLVGKIVNHHGAAQVKRGEEKGYFQFGGSTVVLLFEKDVLQPDAELLRNSENHAETIVKYGEKIGVTKLG